MEEVRQKSWFGRNWLWVLPVGGCLTVILLFVFGIGAAIFGATKMMKNNEAYEYAFEQASHNEELIAVIGEPIETNGIMQGTINYNNGVSSADIMIPLKGPNGEASVSVKGEKRDSTWVYEKLFILIKDTQEEINLLEKGMEGN